MFLWGILLEALCSVHHPPPRMTQLQGLISQMILHMILRQLYPLVYKEEVVLKGVKTSHKYEKMHYFCI